MKSLVLGSVSALLLAGLVAPSADAQVFRSQREQNAQNGQVNGQVNGQANPPQSFPSQQSGELNQSGVTLQTTLERDETLYLDKKKTYDYDLVLRTASAIGAQRLPVGTIVRGRFEPAEGGLVYRASSIELADRIFQVNAYSELLRDIKDPRQRTTGAILTDAAIGAAGGYVLGEVLGDAGVIEVVGGAAAGVLVGNTTAPFVVVIKPEDPITLFTN
ncbi:MAG: hypothetical protein AAF050_22085 [Cyanobacteria bacterium J06649_5]